MTGELTSRTKRTYTLGQNLQRGEMFDIYSAVKKTDGGDMPVIVKFAIHPDDNEFILHEAEVLTRLGSGCELTDKDNDFVRYLPTSLDILTGYDGEFEGREGLVFEPLVGFYSLEEVNAAYPAGVDFQTAVWMFNRLLEGLGYAHSNGIIHGALLPSHVAIRPKNHAGKITDWSAAAVCPRKTGAIVRLLYDAYRDFYPDEIANRIPPTPATDIFMAAKCIIHVLGGDPTDNSLPDNVPDYIQDFLRSCLIADPDKRPADAWRLRDEFGVFMGEHYGPPEYHEFSMPNRGQTAPAETDEDNGQDD